MKATSVERGALTRRLQRSALAGIIGALTLGACGNDGPKYGEIPRDAGRSGSAGKGGMATALPVGGAGGENEAGGAGGEDSSGGTRAGSSAGGKGGTGGKGGMGGTSVGGSGGSGGTSTSKCGNNVVDDGETCDDGNKLSGDGCSSECQCACEACEASVACNSRANHIPDVEPFLPFYEQGYQMAGLATEGPAANIPRKDLFRDALDCVRQTQCLQVVPGASGNVVLVKCACLNPPLAGQDASQWPAACFNADTLMPGPCLRQFLEAAEADSLLALKERVGTQEYAIGLVQGILNNCDAAECRSECFTPEQTTAWPVSTFDSGFECDDCESTDACTAQGGAAP
jgi:cysteine-rich repeat protein